jgi:hypothetical protein
MGPFYLKKTKMATISGIPGSVAILKIVYYILGAVHYSRLPIFILIRLPPFFGNSFFVK